MTSSRRDKKAPEAEAGREQEPFLSRWSRRKEEARREGQEPVPPKAVDPEAPAPELPPLDKLTLESDYRGFFHPKVSEDMRRAALRKLFSDPHFNVMDGLDVYIDDYSKTEPIPAAMLAGLRQAQQILDWAKEDEEKLARESAPRVVPEQPRELAVPATAAVPDVGAMPAGDPVAVSPGDTATKSRSAD
jgi:hypothetical protein